jgi:error-prone DNA polymerase
MIQYAELHCLSNFSFQRGASNAMELLRRAKDLGYHALAITDECSLAGIVRAWEAAKDADLKLIVGSEVKLTDGTKLVLLAPDTAGYAQMCSLITRSRRRSEKRKYALTMTEVCSASDRLLALWIPQWPAQGIPETPFHDQLTALHPHFGSRLWIAWERHLHPEDRQRLAVLRRLGRHFGLPLIAAGDVHYHVRERQRLHDVMTCVRTGCTIRDLRTPSFPNAERHLRPLSTLQRLYPVELLRETVAIAERCTFELSQLKYQYPEELVPEGLTASQYLRQLTEAGICRRWPDGCPPDVRATIEKELALIEDLRYEHYFLTVEDIIRFARSKGILCQGRGSAANSSVCYALGVTEVDPARVSLLFERFISKERAEPPDIDIDFEHQRREEVIQYIYGKYGRERAAIAATVISYRRRSAARDVGKALGLPLDLLDALSKSLAYWDDDAQMIERLRTMGFGTDSLVLKQLVALVNEIEDMPRHLSQHVGGFVISNEPLSNHVPIENAAMADRTVIQWDKDDLEALGLLKVDCLALGMLSALRRALTLVSDYRGTPLTLATVPAEDPKTYDMIGRGETIGVFQIESRAQMSMLPRLKPKTFFDLVIEVAIVRPGPIQGDMVHPYLRRREGTEVVEYPSEALRKVLAPTLGVPLFQEQVMSIAIVAAGFSAGEADQVRRSMAAWKRRGGLEKFHDKLLAGMRERGYDDGFAEQIYQQILGFGSYGFPQSHAASFALLTYVSCWLKCHEPAAFCAALLNSQPMGFYGPAQLVNEARRNGVRFRPVDVTVSGWDCVLERGADGEPEVRLGLRVVSGLAESDGIRIVQARTGGPFVSVEDLANRAKLARRALDALAEGGALEPLTGHRHSARWAAAGAQRLDGVLRESRVQEAMMELPSPTEGENLRADYRSLKLTLGRHPLALLRSRLRRIGALTAEQLHAAPNGRRVRAAGIVTHRQRPGTASGVVFATLEDETGTANLVIWTRVFEACREAVIGSSLMVVDGQLQSAHGVVHVIASHVHDYSAWLGRLDVSSRDFH